MERLNCLNRKVVGVIVAYFLIYVVWGSTYFFIGVALKDFSPFLLGALRFTAAGLILLGICYLRGEQIFKKSLVKSSAISGIVLLFVDMAVVMLAQRYLTSSLVAIIASSTALWILLLDIPMWRTNFCNPFTIIGGMIGFWGVVMLYAEQFHAEWLHPYSERGVLLLIFGCISWALGTLYAKYRSSREEEVNAFAGSAWQMLFARKLVLLVIFDFFWFFAGIFGICLVVESASGCRSRDTCLCQSFYSCSFRSLFRK